jgi:hypothetical protein
MSLATTARPLPSLRLAAVAERLAVWALVINVAGMLAVSLVMRTWQLDHLPGINGDEAWYGIQAMRLLNGEEFSWRTPTNNLLNPFFFLPLLVLHTVASPSAALLRWPAAASGVLALAVNYGLCRRVFNRQTAVLTTVLLAVLPVNIAYSRFGWDTSQTLLATLPAVYLPLLAARHEQYRTRWLIAAALAFLASLVVHPTNIFTAPLLAIPLVWISRAEFLAVLRQQRPAWQWISSGCVCLAALGAVGWQAQHWLATIAGRLSSPGQLVEFVWHYERLFSGLTIYRYIAGSNLCVASSRDWLLLDLAWWCLLAVAAIGYCCRMRHLTAANVWIDGCLLCGWAVMLCGFFLVAGPGAIAPHYERYALCLLAPGTVVLGRGLAWWLSRRETSVVATAAAVSLGWLMLLGTQQHYFAFIHRTGGKSHDTFRTAEEEPKQAALQIVLRERNPERIAWVVTAEYWNEKPLAYLAAVEDQLLVENWSAVRSSAALKDAIRERRAWFVEFAGSEACHEVREFLALQSTTYRETTINDYAGQAVLVLFGPDPGCDASAEGPLSQTSRAY